MIKGIGIDLVDKYRFRQIIQKYGNKFAYKILSNSEYVEYKEISNKESFLSKRFAAKEAFSKALGTGISNGINFNEIVILNKKSGKPYINIIGETTKILKKKFKRKKSKISLSLSDEKKYAVAFVTISL